jgi:hypothetical protein
LSVLSSLHYCSFSYDSLFPSMLIFCSDSIVSCLLVLG